MLIAAALQEELDTALGVCKGKRRASTCRLPLWAACCAGSELHFLRTGVGPLRAEERLRLALVHTKPSQILVIGYAGALEPTLKVGDLVVGQRAAIFGESSDDLPIQDIELAGSWELAQRQALLDAAFRAGIRAHCGQLLTSPHIIGDPAQKLILRNRFEATAIDMETAALARVGSASGIGVSCVRAVTDEAGDEFLAPFSYDPGAGFRDRAAKVIAAGNWIRRCRDWRRRAALARSVLREFFRVYFQDIALRPGS